MLVDEDDSRSSSRVREHGNFLLVSQLHVAIQDTLKSMSMSSHCVNKSMDCSLSTGPHRSDMICVYVFVCVFVLIQAFNRHWHTTGKQVSPCLQMEFWFLVGFCWEPLPPPATSEPNSFIQLSSKEIFGGGRGDAYTFS